MKTNLTLTEREETTHKVLCVAQPTAIGEEQLWTVYEDGDELPPDLM